MPASFTPDQLHTLQTAEYLWLTTVRADGMPQPTPVWFLWQDDHFLIYSQPAAQKVKNIRANPKVALSYTSTPDAHTYLVVMGEAALVEGGVPLTEVPAYLEKYRQGIQALGWEPAGMAAGFSTAIRITPTRVRGE